MPRGTIVALPTRDARQAAKSTVEGRCNVGTEENRQIAVRYLELSGLGEYDAGLDFLADDFLLKGMGMPPMGYTVPKSDLRKMIGETAAKFTKPITFAVVGTTAEGDNVAVEATRQSDTPDGDRYEQRYHFLFEFENGRIKELREYNCTHMLHEFRRRQAAR